MRPNIPQLKLGNIQGYSPIFKTAYAWIFVQGHYQFFKAPRFPQTTLSENCLLLGTDNVCGQISLVYFVPNGGYIYTRKKTK